MYNTMLKTLAKCCKTLGLNEWAAWLTSSLPETIFLPTIARVTKDCTTSAHARITIPAGPPKNKPKTPSPQAAQYRTSGSFASYQSVSPSSIVSGHAP